MLIGSEDTACDSVLQQVGPTGGHRPRYVAAVLLLLLTLACGEPASDTGAGGIDSAGSTSEICQDAPQVSWAGWADGFFQGYCRSCHSSTTPDRRGAPEGVDFDTLDQVREQADLVRWSVIEEGRMPVGGGVYEDDLYLLEVFLDCTL
ncbi:MAG: hypothetical protein H6742_08500 [Alphaproteobacteria bacterium]|nr:hypothetical protein [Alphaproteobacteria bacterium]